MSADKIDRRPNPGPNTFAEMTLTLQRYQREKAAQTQRRKQRLREVFKMFDLDGSGEIEMGELQQLGQARRLTGQKTRKWTPKRNFRQFDKMDKDGDGRVSEIEFVDYFEQELPRDTSEFEKTVDQFLQVAIYCRQLKLSRNNPNIPPPELPSSPTESISPEPEQSISPEPEQHPEPEQPTSPATSSPAPRHFTPSTPEHPKDSPDVTHDQLKQLMAEKQSLIRKNDQLEPLMAEKQLLIRQNRRLKLGLFGLSITTATLWVLNTLMLRGAHVLN